MIVDHYRYHITYVGSYPHTSYYLVNSVPFESGGVKSIHLFSFYNNNITFLYLLYYVVCVLIFYFVQAPITNKHYTSVHVILYYII